MAGVNRFLLSYWYYRRADVAAIAEAIAPVQLMADSGAFSAYTQGADLKLDDYAAWLMRWRDHLHIYANLDVIRDPEATAVNQAALESMGLTPLPVYHYGSPLSVLEGLVERYDYVALGGMVGFRQRELGAHLVRCFRIGADTRFHGFGMTSWPLIRDFPFYSVDSSSWTMGERFGMVDLFDLGKWSQAIVGDPVSVYRSAALIREAGVPPEQIADRTKFHRLIAARVSAYHWRKAERWLMQRHGKGRIYLAAERAKPIEKSPLAVGQVYLAGDGHPLSSSDLVPGRIYLAAEPVDISPPPRWRSYHHDPASGIPVHDDAAR